MIESLQQEDRDIIRGRLHAIRRTIEATRCEALLPGLELYARELERLLEYKAPEQ